MPAVSVIVPTYNCAWRLVRALESVAAQGWPHRHLELIVVDDGSSDDTAECVRAFAARTDIATRYVFQQNAGPAAARNHGLRLARGTAVAFLDADDRWHPQKLERQVPLLHGRVGLAYCANRYVDADDRPLDAYVRDVALHRGDILLALFCDFFLLTSAVVLSREALDLAGCFDENLPVGEDYEFFLRVACSHHADYAAEPLLVRCVRPDSLSRRDYALDARIDLATLQAFVDAHPDFARRHREPVRRRLARYRYDFAWRLLAEGRRSEAIAQLLHSLRTRASRSAARTLLRALLPQALVARRAGTRAAA